MMNVGDKVEVGDMLLVVESMGDMTSSRTRRATRGHPPARASGRRRAGGALAANEADIVSGGGRRGCAAAAALRRRPRRRRARRRAGRRAGRRPGRRAGGGRVVWFLRRTLAEEKVDINGGGHGLEGRIGGRGRRAAAAAGTALAPHVFVEAGGDRGGEAGQVQGIDLATIKGTGNFGRVTPDDVLIAAGEAPKPKPGAPLPAAAPAAAAPAAAAAPRGAAAAAPAAPAPAGTVPMNAMQKAVVNMEWANAVPTYQVSRDHDGVSSTRSTSRQSRAPPRRRWRRRPRRRSPSTR